MQTPARISQATLDWDLLRTVLDCPACRSEALEYKDGDTVACQACSSSYQVIEGVVDFLGDDKMQTPAFYRNSLYRDFESKLLEIHQAHYKSGSASNLIEDRMKQHSFKLIENPSGLFVDLGCGTGSDIDRLQTNNGFIGVDSQIDLLRQAKRKHPKLTFIRADLSNLPFKRNSLENVICNSVLEHVFFLEKALENIQTSLAENGRFYVGIPTEGGLAVELARLVTSSRNAKILGISRSDCARAQRMDHCNTVFSIENALRKYFEIEHVSMWPFRIGPAQFNLFKSFRLKHLQTNMPDLTARE